MISALAFLCVQQQLEQRVSDVLPRLPVCEAGVFHSAGPHRMVQILPPTYMDDLAIAFVQPPDVADAVAPALPLMRVAARVAAVVRELMADFGLRLNWAAGKTVCATGWLGTWWPIARVFTRPPPFGRWPVPSRGDALPPPWS